MVQCRQITMLTQIFYKHTQVRTQTLVLLREPTIFTHFSVHSELFALNPALTFIFILNRSKIQTQGTTFSHFAKTLKIFNTKKPFHH